jgi:TetR/AcrR family transcriptional regulator, regulator of cefoperazone and chloramphenicol sensitivity
MTEKEFSTQEAILLATIDCINENGIEHLTTRMIAEKAGANIASINYYFRTKEILVNQALEITIKHMLEDVNETINNQKLGFREILKDVIYYLISGASSNMGISSAHLYRLVIDKDYESISAVSFLEAFNSLLDRAIVNFPDREIDQLRRILASIFSSIMFMMLTPFFFQLKEEKQLSEEKFHHEMAEHYTDMFYAAV